MVSWTYKLTLLLSIFKASVKRSHLISFELFKLENNHKKAHKNKWTIPIFIIPSWHLCNNFDNVLEKQAAGGGRRQRNMSPSRKGGGWFILCADLGSLLVVMIIISESQRDTWQRIHSSIFFMRQSILTLILYLYLHWTYSWIISISFPLAPVKHGLAQVATSGFIWSR